MPKTKQLEITVKRRRIMACIKSRQTLDGLTDRGMAVKARISSKTFGRRKQKPEEFSIKELWGMGIKVYLSNGDAQLLDGSAQDI